MKIAIVHDYLNQFGGAERVVEALHELYPDAPIYTSIYDRNRLPESFLRMDIRTTFMQNLPFVFSLYRYYLLLYPLAFSSLDLSEYDVVLSSSSAFAKGFRKCPGQLHICYCYTPMRFVYRFLEYVEGEAFPWWLKKLLPVLLASIRQWDLANNRSVDAFLAISGAIADRIKLIYGRESDIIFPPVETQFFRPSNIDRDYYLIVSRLNHYKRVDLAVEAFNKLDMPLKIIGDGPARKSLEKLARPNVEFLGRLSDEQVARYLSECRALIFPGEEDFGIVPVEAMACGRPVIAFNAAGAKETVVDGKTGILFEPQTAAALVQAIKRFKFEIYDKNRIREHALRFDKSVFKRQIEEFMRGKYEEKFGKN